MDDLPYGYSMKSLQALTVAGRQTIWERARKSDTEQDRRLVQAIEKAGPFNVKNGIRDDDLISHQIHQIVYSDEGRAACVREADRGEPALAGVEPLIIAALRNDYASTYMATVQAGSIVGQLMRSLNYKKVGIKPMPGGSVAQTAATWKHGR